MFKLKSQYYFYRYAYAPNYFCAIVSMLLSPLAMIYYFIIVLKFKFAKKEKFDIPIISVGNLILGGTGKTPLTKAIFKAFSQDKKTFIILRGYKRASKGMKEVCLNGKILCDENISGDEAYEYAISLQKANIIVSEDRKKAIKRAIELGAELVILDDGFGKFDIEKFEILLKPYKEPTMNLVLPSGIYRYPKSFYKKADFLADKDSTSSTSYIKNQKDKMVLVTGIANPFRLKNYFDLVESKVFFPDHYKFKKQELEKILKLSKTDSILTTYKDYVKIKDFDLPISLIVLESKLKESLKLALENYIENYKKG